MTVSVARLSLTYRVPVRASGLRAAMRSLVDREYREVEAVRSVSFEIGQGEVVGFIGPNGAGKTSTLKMLSGILHPTSGRLEVLGYEPRIRDHGFLRQIALIRGSQPIGGPPELTVLDALRFQQLVYEVDDVRFRESLHMLGELLGIDRLFERQVRALSLGERMRCGLALALIYKPNILFLDEPTIGMDVSAVEQTRNFIRDYVRTTNATVLLTSHYMADVEQLCDRIIMIDRGEIAYDGSLDALAARVSPYRLITISMPATGATDWSRYGEISEKTDETVALRVPSDCAPSVARDILQDHRAISGMTITQPSFEHVMDRAYREGVA